MQIIEEYIKNQNYFFIFFKSILNSQDSIFDPN